MPQPSATESPVLLPAHNASEWTGPTGNNTWLLRGRVPTLIDAGVGRPEHLDAIAQALEGAALTQVLITHRHVDHASGADALAARWPSVAIRRLGGGLASGDWLDAGSGRIHAIHTPGHAPDHCCFELAGGAGLFCGDLARIGGTVVIPASKGGDLADYLASLRSALARRARRWYPGHGPPIDDPASLVNLYLRHRAERDAQILAVLRRGAASPRQIVAGVYPPLSPEIAPAAADTVLAHLIKLRAEGHVVERGGAWSLAQTRRSE